MEDSLSLQDFDSGTGTLEATWWVMDTEPGMDDLAQGAADMLQKMKDDLKIYPFQDRQKKDRLFLARFELPKLGADFQFPEAVFAEGEVAGWIDFLGGFPIDDVEMMVIIGEFSIKADQVTVKDGTGKAAAPVPEKFFDWPDKDKVLFNLTALATKNVAQVMAPNLEGEPKPAKAHWWLRVNLVGDTAKFPVPGEFLGLGVRMMPDVSWGKQKSSPFVYSGNWMDTVFYTTAVIKAIQEPTAVIPYCIYTVTWRGHDVENVKPSDFCEYRVGDRVTILKDIATTKASELWKDTDQQTFGSDWMIVPITFYGLDKEA